MTSTNKFQNRLNRYLGDFYRENIEPLSGSVDEEAEQQAAHLANELAQEIAQSIGGTAGDYDLIAARLVSEIPEFSMVNWWITVHGDQSCTVKTDAGSIHIHACTVVRS